MFEYEESGYRNDLEIRGFSEIESNFICRIFPFFYQEYQAIKTEDFDFSKLKQMILELPSDKKELLTDHIVLSAINQSSDYRTLLTNIKINLCNVGECLPFEYYRELDFCQFFKGIESSFMNEYYPSKDEQNEIREQYSLKYKD